MVGIGGEAQLTLGNLAIAGGYTPYGFLVDNYRTGDEIFLFGFSRGAFVVRALAGVIVSASANRASSRNSTAPPPDPNSTTGPNSASRCAPTMS